MANPLTEQIEPDAAAAEVGFEAALVLSQAISLKRIADAQVQIADRLKDWTWQGTLATTPFSGGN